MKGYWVFWLVFIGILKKADYSCFHLGVPESDLAKVEFTGNWL